LGNVSAAAEASNGTRQSSRRDMKTPVGAGQALRFR
jgi:hypothetical protein